jgi:hypothetical protein
MGANAVLPYRTTSCLATIDAREDFPLHALPVFDRRNNMELC